MTLSLMVPSSPIFSPEKLHPMYCKSDGSSFSSSPRINGSQAPSSPLPLLLSPTRSPQSPSSSLKSPLSNAVKGKRPGMIEIPTSMAVQLSFAAETPRGEEEVQVEGEGYSVYCKRGRRGRMEDRYSAAVDPKQAIFGVYDGHGGSKAAEFVAKNLDKKVTEEVSKTSEDDDIDDAIREAYLATDMDFLKEDLGGGTCCVTAMIRKGDLFVSNAGDCRAVLSRNGVAEALTSDHQPSRQDERDRIEALGGYVDRCRGVWRIQGSLAVSRAFGDQHLKQWVIAEPETRMLKIKPECEFLILASDGLWNKVTNEEAIDLVRPLCVGLDKPKPFSACKKLAELSSWRGSFDDISVMIVLLQHFVPGLS